MNCYRITDTETTIVEKFDVKITREEIKDQTDIIKRESCLETDEDHNFEQQNPILSPIGKGFCSQLNVSGKRRSRSLPRNLKRGISSTPTSPTCGQLAVKRQKDKSGVLHWKPSLTESKTSSSTKRSNRHDQARLNVCHSRSTSCPVNRTSSFPEVSFSLNPHETSLLGKTPPHNTARLKKNLMNLQNKTEVVPIRMDNSSKLGMNRRNSFVSPPFQQAKMKDIRASYIGESCKGNGENIVNCKMENCEESYEIHLLGNADREDIYKSTPFTDSFSNHSQDEISHNRIITNDTMNIFDPISFNKYQVEHAMLDCAIRNDASLEIKENSQMSDASIIVEQINEKNSCPKKEIDLIENSVSNINIQYKASQQTEENYSLRVNKHELNKNARQNEAALHVENSSVKRNFQQRNISLSEMNTSTTCCSAIEMEMRRKENCTSNFVDVDKQCNVEEKYYDEALKSNEQGDNVRKCQSIPIYVGGLENVQFQQNVPSSLRKEKTHASLHKINYLPTSCAHEIMQEMNNVLKRLDAATGNNESKNRYVENNNIKDKFFDDMLANAKKISGKIAIPYVNSELTNETHSSERFSLLQKHTLPLCLAFPLMQQRIDPISVDCEMTKTISPVFATLDEILQTSTSVDMESVIVQPSSFHEETFTSCDHIDNGLEPKQISLSLMENSSTVQAIKSMQSHVVSCDSSGLRPTLNSYSYLSSCLVSSPELIYHQPSKQNGITRSTLCGSTRYTARLETFPLSMNGSRDERTHRVNDSQATYRLRRAAVSQSLLSKSSFSAMCTHDFISTSESSMELRAAKSAIHGTRSPVSMTFVCSSAKSNGSICYFPESTAQNRCPMIMCQSNQSTDEEICQQTSCHLTTYDAQSLCEKNDTLLSNLTDCSDDYHSFNDELISRLSMTPDSLNVKKIISKQRLMASKVTLSNKLTRKVITAGNSRENNINSACDKRSANQLSVYVESNTELAKVHSLLRETNEMTNEISSLPISYPVEVLGVNVRNRQSGRKTLCERSSYKEHSSSHILTQNLSLTHAKKLKNCNAKDNAKSMSLMKVREKILMQRYAEKLHNKKAICHTMTGSNVGSSNSVQQITTCENVLLPTTVERREIAKITDSSLIVEINDSSIINSKHETNHHSRKIMPKKSNVTGDHSGIIQSQVLISKSNSGIVLRKSSLGQRHESMIKSDKIINCSSSFDSMKSTQHPQQANWNGDSKCCLTISQATQKRRVTWCDGNSFERRTESSFNQNALLACQPQLVLAKEVKQTQMSELSYVKYFYEPINNRNNSNKFRRNTKASKICNIARRCNCRDILNANCRTTKSTHICSKAKNEQQRLRGQESENISSVILASNCQTQINAVPTSNSLNVHNMNRSFENISCIHLQKECKLIQHDIMEKSQRNCMNTRSSRIHWRHSNLGYVKQICISEINNNGNNSEDDMSKHDIDVKADRNVRESPRIVQFKSIEGRNEKIPTRSSISTSEMNSKHWYSVYGPACACTNGAAASKSYCREIEIVQPMLLKHCLGLQSLTRHERCTFKPTTGDKSSESQNNCGDNHQLHVDNKQKIQPQCVRNQGTKTSTAEYNLYEHVEKREFYKRSDSGFCDCSINDGHQISTGDEHNNWNKMARHASRCALSARYVQATDKNIYLPKIVADALPYADLKRRTYLRCCCNSFLEQHHLASENRHDGSKHNLWSQSGVVNKEDITRPSWKGRSNKGDGDAGWKDSAQMNDIINCKCSQCKNKIKESVSSRLNCADSTHGNNEHGITAYDNSLELNYINCQQNNAEDVVWTTCPSCFKQKIDPGLVFDSPNIIDRSKSMCEIFTSGSCALEISLFSACSHPTPMVNFTSLNHISIPVVDSGLLQFMRNTNNDYYEVGRGTYGCVYLALINTCGGWKEVVVKVNIRLSVVCV